MSKKLVSVSLFVIVTFSLTGCDQLNKLYEMVSSKKEALVKKTTASSAQQAASAPSQAQQTAPAPNVDQANVVVRVGN